MFTVLVRSILTVPPSLRVKVAVLPSVEVSALLTKLFLMPVTVTDEPSFLFNVVVASPLSAYTTVPPVT
ncbi:hypothetical protein FEA34_00685 [Mannheimia haemolytica]|nr:hypothetical protein COI_2048 [Mannheimia haemolytica serotype A2 str. OVINE]EEY13382.1 hypothetical protein COK_0523 [Mannheimia haemolytica serotype A2 str. BOVINE]TRC03304.1 hypothetical protein FEA39_12470 [Mannheimia haemolytica]TRC08609.1 hypothetical protein FEA43_12475 [Mannheimia haemolytica]TRC12646.1 hypothetical protein FEA41_12430 [Mannheimia haemolytica]